MPTLIRVTDDTTVLELDEAITSLAAARTSANPVRHEMLTERIDTLLDERWVRAHRDG